MTPLFKLNEFPKAGPKKDFKSPKNQANRDPEQIEDIYLGDFNNPNGTQTSEMLSTPLGDN